MSGIVVGIDGSHKSSPALDWAMSEAALRDAELTVITVHPVPPSRTGDPWPFPGDQDVADKIQQSAQQAVDTAAAALGDQQPKSVTVVAVNGFPAKTLIDASQDADLLVVGSRGGGGFRDLLVGPVTSQVVHHAKCPVVVVPAGQ